MFLPQGRQAIVQSGKLQLRTNHVLLAHLSVSRAVTGLGGLHQLFKKATVIFYQSNALLGAQHLEPKPGNGCGDPGFAIQTQERLLCGKLLFLLPGQRPAIAPRKRLADANGRLAHALPLKRGVVNS